MFCWVCVYNDFYIVVVVENGKFILRGVGVFVGVRMIVLFCVGKRRLM